MGTGLRRTFERLRLLFRPSARASGARRAAAVALGAALLGGCAAGADGPELLSLDALRYHEAFDAAVEAARLEGMPPVLRDRRAGVIESEPEFAGSALEPWRTDNASFDQAVENTLAFQRRRVRFEFKPAGFGGSALRADTPLGERSHDDVLTGPEIVVADQPPLDLTSLAGPMELRVWVFVERAHAPGVRRSPWTRMKTTTARLIAPESAGGLPESQFWSPVARDVAYERRLLARVHEALESPPGTQPSATN